MFFYFVDYYYQFNLILFDLMNYFLISYQQYLYHDDFQMDYKDVIINNDYLVNLMVIQKGKIIMCYCNYSGKCFFCILIKCCFTKNCMDFEGLSKYKHIRLMIMRLHLFMLFFNSIHPNCFIMVIMFVFIYPQNLV